MAGKTYSAGTIFLQVVPVFGDMQRSIRREVNDLNKTLSDDLEKGAKDAGQRAGKTLGETMAAETEKGAKKAANSFEKELKTSLNAIERDLKPIQPKFESNEVRKQITDLRREIGDLRKEANKGLNPRSYKEIGDRLRVLQAHASGLNQDFSDLQKHDFQKTVAGLDKLVKRMDSVRKASEIEVMTDFTPARHQMSLFEKKARETTKKVAGYFGSIGSEEVAQIRADLEKLSDTEIGVDMDATEFTVKLRQLQSQLLRLSTSGAEVDVVIASAKAEADLAVLTAAVRALDGQDITVDVDARGVGKTAAEIGLLRTLFGGASSDAENAANSFRSFNWVVLALAGLLPGLIPMIGALGGALLGLLPILAAVTAGFGGMFVGFSGLGDAVTALGDVENEHAKTSADHAKTMRDAGYAVADAKQAVADAERSAAQAAEDAARQVARAREAAAKAVKEALDRQREAQRAYKDSVDDVREAEKALREARKRAAEELKADKDDIADRLRQGDLAIREAQLAAFDATNSYNAVMADGSSTAYDKEAAEVAMLQARERLHELREAQAELTEEQKKNAKAKVKDNTEVKRAETELERALEAQRKATERLKKASQDVSQARVDGARRVADAVRNQQRAEADGARNVARAQEALRRAQESYGDALFKTGEVGSAAMQRLEEAMGNLGPEGREFARFLFGLQKGFVDLRKEVQARMLPGVQAGLQGIIDYFGPAFTRFMGDMGGVVGAFAIQVKDALTSAPWTTFFSTMAEAGPVMAANFNTTLLNFFTGLAAVLTAATPWALKMSEAWVRSSEAFATWAASKEGIDAVERLMGYFERVGPTVGAFLGALWDALKAIGKAISPWGEMVLGVLTDLLNWIAGLDTKKLGTFLAIVASLTIAFQLAAGAVAIVNGGMAIMAFLGSRVIFFAFGLVGAVVALGVQYEWLGDLLKRVWEFLGDNRDALMKVAEAALIAFAAFKVIRTIMAIVTGIQLGLAAATYGAVGAAYAQGAAAKIAYWGMMLMRGGLLKAAVAQWAMNAATYAFPLVWIVLALVAVGVALYVLWKKSETFRKIVTGVWEAVKAGLKLLWNYWKWAFAQMWKFLKGAFGYMKWAWEKILWPVLKVIGKIVWELLKLVFRPVLNMIKGAWEKLWAGMKHVWNNGGKKTFDWIKDALVSLKDRFKDQVDRIGNIWEGLKNLLATPIRFFLETVMNNGIIKGWNKFAKLVGADTIEDIPIPSGLYPSSPKNQGKSGGSSKGGTGQTYATGGILPGYTPGRDVHHFVSPTAGNLHLSGGEAIMRPEFTAEVGSGWIHAANAAARRGRSALRAFLSGAQAYAKGGVFWPTTFRSLSPDYPGHTGVDISIPGSADYGLPVFAAHSGRAVRRDYGGSSYGNSVWIDGNGFTTIYAHLSKALVSTVGAMVRGGQQIGNVGSTGNSSGPHLHFEVRPGATRAAALAYLAGSYSPSGGSPYTGTPGEGDVASFPKMLRTLAKNPLKWAKSLYEGPVAKLRSKFDGDIASGIASLPGSAVTAIRDKAIGLLPAPLDLVAKAAAKVSDKALGKGDPAPDTDQGGAYANGGILPYNGTMKYDAGGYLPPGLTSVVNLTGKPEPVFTAEQFAAMGGAGGAGITFENQFIGTDLTAEDVTDELEFMLRKHRLTGGGRYGRRG